jgi:hypothetical protein
VKPRLLPQGIGIISGEGYAAKADRRRGCGDGGITRDRTASGACLRAQGRRRGAGRKQTGRKHGCRSAGHHQSARHHVMFSPSSTRLCSDAASYITAHGPATAEG